MGAQGLGSRAIIGSFYEALDGYIGSSWISRIGMRFPSDQSSETYKWLGQVPGLREWVGSRLAKGFTENGITIENKVFEATLDVLVDEIRRDKTSQVMIRVTELADRAGEHWGKLMSTLISNGTGSTNGLAYDGQYFFDDDHSEGSSGVQKNLLAAGDVAALDVSTATVPTPVESAKAIIGVIGHMLGLLDNEGEPMNANAKQFTVMCGVKLWQHLATGVYSTLVSNGSSNPALAIIQNSGLSITMEMNPRLTSTTVFYVFRDDARTAPFILQSEQDIKISAKAEGSEYEFDNRAHQYGIEAIRNVGYGMWQQAAHATLS